MKIGGELLAGDQGFGIDETVLSRVASEVKEVHDLGCDVALVLGGGNFVRGLVASAKGMDRATADYMGMLATVINSLAMQEALEKIAASADSDVRWHLLGHLQTNKARKAAVAFAMIQSLDSVELLRKLDAAAADAGRSPELLVQVDLAGEATKYGARPDEVPAIFEAAAACRAARVVGVMTLPPIPENPEDSRRWFRRVQELRQGWLAAGVPPAMLREVSMGMSGDFDVAVQEGATIVRVGTAIFGRRRPGGADDAPVR